MDIVTHLNEYYKLYSGVLTLLLLAATGWLSVRFVPRKDFESFKKSSEDESKRISATLAKLEGEIKHLPTATQIADLTRQIAYLNGKMEGSAPLINQLVKNDEMLIQNEISKEKK